MLANEATILIVDNDPIMLTGIAAVLNHEGFVCHCAADSEAAFKAARAIVPDLMVCDVDLGGESGLDLYRDFYRQETLQDIPVVFLASAGRPDVIEMVREVGGAYCLTKPFDPHVLIDIVDRALWMPHLIRTRVEQSHVKRPKNPAQSVTQ